jgi:DNA-binding MarR family transcriptional regulator
MNHAHNEGAPIRAVARDALARVFELTVVLADTMAHGLSERGLTRARATVVWVLHEAGPRTQRELSQAIGTTPRNVTGLLDGLEADGFVVRGPHPTDRRATLVSLTDRGREAGAMLNAEQEEFAALLFDDIDEDRLTAFVDTLGQVLTRLHTADSDTIRQAALRRIERAD